MRKPTEINDPIGDADAYAHFIDKMFPKTETGETFPDLIERFWVKRRDVTGWETGDVALHCEKKVGGDELKPPFPALLDYLASVLGKERNEIYPLLRQLSLANPKFRVWDAERPTKDGKMRRSMRLAIAGVGEDRASGRAAATTFAIKAYGL